MKVLASVVILSVVSLAFAAPHLPEYFVMNWRIFSSHNSTALPPWGPVPPVPCDVGTGTTYYDWTEHRMLEVYNELCVPIFEQGSNFPCHFLNVNETSYLLTWKTDTQPPCCIFGQPFSPPAPNFLDVAKVPFNQSTMLYGNKVDWWVLDGDDPAEPFGYGFYHTADQAQQHTPAGFWFRSFDGFASQEFHDFKVQRPSPETWTVPDICTNAPACNN